SPLRQLAGLGPSPHPLGKWGKYELLSVIGEGGMGVVYRARHIRLENIVALKMIRSGRLATTDARRRFEREAKTLAKLQHPNIVRIHDYGDHDGQPYLTMDLIDGKTLDASGREFPRDPRGAARLIAAVARAVGHAHALNIIHRDLKPGNILLDAESRPYV